MKSKIKGKLECAICGKGVQMANLVSFSKRRIKHVRRPNLHSHKIKVEGSSMKIRVCTSCKRQLRQADKAAQNQVTQSA